jgi:hypothetical protein
MEEKETKQRFKILVETREITYTNPKTRETIVYQPKLLLTFKRYGKDENEAQAVLKEFLLRYYSTDWEIKLCEVDKTHPAEQTEIK